MICLYNGSKLVKDGSPVSKKIFNITRFVEKLVKVASKSHLALDGDTWLTPNGRAFRSGFWNIFKRLGRNYLWTAKFTSAMRMEICWFGLDYWLLRIYHFLHWSLRSSSWMVRNGRITWLYKKLFFLGLRSQLVISWMQLLISLIRLSPLIHIRNKISEITWPEQTS